MELPITPLDDIADWQLATQDHYLRGKTDSVSLLEPDHFVQPQPERLEAVRARLG